MVRAAPAARSVIVVGAGAAGLIAAIFAARAGGDVLVIERTAEGGKKILISGGGRCNVLPSQLAPERFVTDSAPHLMRRLLRSWPLAKQREFFERDLKLPLALEPETGKLFPASNRARDIRDGLLHHALNLRVRVQFDVSLTAIEPVDAGWLVHTTQGPLRAERVVIATGGLSVPATGSDGTGLRVAEALGHRVNAVYPALTPLVAQPAVHAGLSGVSLKVRLRARDVTGSGVRRASSGRVVETSGGFLFTHRGYSGPSVLDISHIATRNRDAVVRVQWSDVAAREWEQLFSVSGGVISNVVSTHMPQRLALHLVQEVGIPPERRAGELRRAERVQLIDALTTYRLPWTGDEGYKKAEVTGGGVALEEVDTRTLESRHHRGLFLCGELLDAFGPIGGHNFAWAWSTGRLAGIAAGEGR
jgi:predicted Rossmann fold flavoprotein